MKNLDEVWKAYFKTKDKALKDMLIVEYISVVKYVVGRFNIYVTTAQVEYEELVGYGLIGLIDAVEKFDLSRGARFETYASKRVYGSILDSLRMLDWAPLALRKKSKAFERTCQQLEFKFGRAPTDEEIAKELNVPIDDVPAMVRELTICNIVSLEDHLEQNKEVAPFDRSGDSETIEEGYLRSELKELLVDTLDRLKEKEKMVVTLYYFENLTVKEISKIMEISESRVSQIHSKAILNLQLKLGKYKDVLFAP